MISFYNSGVLVLYFVRDLLIALLSTILMLFCGTYLGLGVLIALDAILPESLWNYFPIWFLPSILLIFAASVLDPSKSTVRRVSRDAIILLLAMIVGSWVGLESQRLTVPHGAEDLGLYDGPSQFGVLALGLLFRRSTRPWMKRSGTIMIVFAALLMTSWAENLVQYSKAFSHLSLNALDRSLLKTTKVVLLFLVGALTALFLARRLRARENLPENPPF